MDSTYILDVVKARQLYAQADDLPWSEERERLELLKQAEKACKAALAKSPQALDALLMHAEVLVEMAAWQLDHPQARKRYFSRGLERFREAAEAHPDAEEPYRGWANALRTGQSNVMLPSADLRRLVLECVRWCERCAVDGRRSAPVKKLWQSAGEFLERIVPDDPEPDVGWFKQIIEVRQRLLETFDDDVHLLNYEALGLIRVAEWLIDASPEEGREVYEYLLSLPERMEELDPGQAGSARLIEAEALRSMAFRRGAESDEVTELWARAEQAFHDARAALAGERDEEGRAGDREALLFRDFTSESLQLAILPAYDGHPSARGMVERTIELLRGAPEVLSPEESDRHLVRIVREIPEVATAFEETDLSMTRQIYEDGLSLLELVDSAALPESGRMRLRAEIFEGLRQAYYRVEPQTALGYAREAADHYAASNELGNIHTPDLLSDWSRAAAHAAQGTAAEGQSDAATHYYRAVSTALAGLDEWETLGPQELFLWAVSHFFTISASSASDETAAREGDIWTGIDLVCRALRQADESSWMPGLVLIGLTLGRKLAAEDEADAIGQIAEAVDANADAVDSPNYIEGLFAARLGETDRAIDLLEKALEAGEVEYEELAAIESGEGLTETERWRQFEATHGPASGDDTATDAEALDELKLPLEFGDAEPEAMD